MIFPERERERERERDEVANDRAETDRFWVMGRETEKKTNEERSGGERKKRWKVNFHEAGREKDRKLFIKMHREKYV